MFDISKKLGNPELNFSIEDTTTRLYSGMIRRADENAIQITRFWPHPLLDPYNNAPDKLILTLPGPAVVTFEGQGNLDTVNWSTSVYTAQPASADGTYPGVWRRGAVAVNETGNQTVEWQARIIHTGYHGTGILRNVQVQKTPAFNDDIKGGPTNVGFEAKTPIPFASIGDTKVYLTRNDEIVQEISNPSNHGTSLEWTPESVEETGVYKIRLVNEHGQTDSNPFELFVGKHPQEGLDSLALGYRPNNSGETMASIWYTQTTDTYDGVDAVSFKKGSQDNGGLSGINIPMTVPAWISFWYKNPEGTVRFGRRNDYIDLDQTEVWKPFNYLASANPSYVLEWRGATESVVLDELLIDYIEEDPFKQWIYPQLNLADFEINIEDVPTADYDGDQKSNLIEWILSGDPLIHDGLPQPLVSSHNGAPCASLTFESPVNLGPYHLQLESSPNLTTWTIVDSEISETPTESPTIVLRTILDPSPIEPDMKRFFRLSAVRSTE